MTGYHKGILLHLESYVILKHTMDEHEINLQKLIPWFMGVIAGTQFMTIVLLMTIPTAKQEFVCRGIIENPDAVRCYEQT